MHNLKIKAALLVVGMGLLTNEVSYAAVTKGESTPSDTIEIISTEMTTTETTTTPSEEKTSEKPTVSTEEKTTEAPTKEDRPTVSTPTVPSKTNTVDRPSTERPTIEQPTVERPTVERPTTEKPSIQQPSKPSNPVISVEPSTSESITKPSASSEEVVKPSSPVNPSDGNRPPADDEKHPNKIDKGKFSPHKGEDYYKSLDKEVSELVTKKLASADDKSVKDNEQSKKHKAQDKEKKNKKKHAQSLPATGETGGLVVGGVALLLVGLILVRRTRA